MLKKLDIRRLFGSFSYSLDFINPDGEALKFITGPNGYGKTTVLAFINSLCRHDLGIFWKTPFESLKFFFDEATIEFRQTISYKEVEEEDFGPVRDKVRLTVLFSLGDSTETNIIDWSSLLIERSKSGEGLQYMWWPLLMKDQSYINRVKARWADVYPDLVEIANRVVEDRRKANRLSDYYNRKIWKVGNYLDWHWQCGDEDMEFDKVMDNLKYVYNKRLENLNRTITNLNKW